MGDRLLRPRRAPRGRSSRGRRDRSRTRRWCLRRFPTRRSSPSRVRGRPGRGTRPGATAPPRSLPRTASSSADSRRRAIRGSSRRTCSCSSCPSAPGRPQGHALPHGLDPVRRHLDQRLALAAARPRGRGPGPRSARTGEGGWRTAIAPMGYPAGKTKTMPIDLSAVLDPADPRVRIRTNLAIYWDRIVYTVDEPPAPLRIVSAPLVSAELSLRGFSRMTACLGREPARVRSRRRVDGAPLGRHGRAATRASGTSARSFRRRTTGTSS